MNYFAVVITCLSFVTYILSKVLFLPMCIVKELSRNAFFRAVICFRREG